MKGDEVRQYLSFLKVLEANPGDRETRLILADWLEERGLDDEANEQRQWNAKRAESEVWLRAYAAKQNSYDDPEEAFKNLIAGLKTDSLYFHGSDLHGLYELDDADELKEHAERYLSDGTKIDWSQFTFSCSC